MKVFVNKRFKEEIDAFKVLHDLNTELDKPIFETDLQRPRQDTPATKFQVSATCQSEYGSDMAISLNDWEDHELPSKIYITDSTSTMTNSETLSKLEPQNRQDVDVTPPKSGLIHKVLGWIGVL